MDFFRNTLAPWQWGLLALIPPAIIALYFLKLRRMPLEVPSTYLWKKSIEDLHVNSLWQRLRKNLLLFLQLLLVALAMLALMRPGWEGTELTGDRFIFLIDNSASMSATDVPDAPNRLEDAKRLVGQLIDQMGGGMTAMIVSFSDTPQVVQEFTDNRRLLRERLESIRPTSHATDLRGALELAGGLANPSRITTDEGGQEMDVVEPQPATVYIFSDGRFEDVKGFSLGNLQPIYVPVGTFEAENLAITAVATRRNESQPERRQAFVQVANFTPSAQKAIVELTLDGRFVDAREVDVPAGEMAGVVFPLADVREGSLAARLKYELPENRTKDSLAQDDVGYAALNDLATGKVLVVTPGNIALEVALATARAGRLAEIRFVTPDALTSDEYKRDAENGVYDLVIYDQCAPPAMPRANTLFIGRLPPGIAWRRSEDASGSDADEQDKTAKAADDSARRVAMPQIIDWDRGHPLLAHVELGSVVLADSLTLEPPIGATVLIDSTAGPIAAIAPRDSYQDAVLGFEIIGRDQDGTLLPNTNWPRRLSFPTFCLNVLEYLAGGDGEAENQSVRPGRAVELHAPPNADKLTVIDPGGGPTAVARSAQDAFVYHGTQQPGVYQVRQGDQVVERFAVNLFDRAESDVRVRPTQDEAGNTVRAADIRIGNVDVTATAERTPARRELWKLILACALFVLVLEWYIYNRRVYL